MTLGDNQIIAKVIKEGKDSLFPNEFNGNDIILAYKIGREEILKEMLDEVLYHKEICNANKEECLESIRAFIKSKVAK